MRPTHIARRLSTPCLVLLSLLAFRATPAGATEVGGARTFGLGFALGDPTGVVAKLFLDRGHALDAGFSFASYGYRDCGNAGFNCSHYGAYGFNADYLWQDNITHADVNLDWHIGAGARLWFFNDNYRFNGRNDGGVAIAARMPLGLDLMFRKPDFLEVFFEIAPSIYVIPGMFFAMDAAIGVRFYF